MAYQLSWVTTQRQENAISSYVLSDDSINEDTLIDCSILTWNLYDGMEPRIIINLEIMVTFEALQICSAEWFPSESINSQHQSKEHTDGRMALQNQYYNDIKFYLYFVELILSAKIL